MASIIAWQPSSPLYFFPLLLPPCIGPSFWRDVKWAAFHVSQWDPFLCNPAGRALKGRMTVKNRGCGATWPQQVHLVGSNSAIQSADEVRSLIYHQVKKATCNIWSFTQGILHFYLGTSCIGGWSIHSKQLPNRNICIIYCTRALFIIFGL